MFRYLLLFVIIVNLESYSNPIPWQILNDVDSIEHKEFNCTSECCKSKYLHLDQPEFQSGLVRAPYDILKYELWVDFSDALRQADLEKNIGMRNYFKGKQIVTLKIDSAGFNIIKLDAADMKISNVVISSKKQPANDFTYNYAENKLSISNKNIFISGDTLEIGIDYSVDRDNRIGFYLYAPGDYVGPNNTIVVEEPLATTFSQPSWAKYWMPCNDKPYDKAISRISIKVPEGFKGVSNGLLDSVTTDKTGEFINEIYHWSHKSPISTYLMVAVGSRFGYFEQIYKRFTNPKDSIKIENYVWQSDLEVPANHPFNAKSALRNQPEMLRAFSEKFGEYAFEKYGTVAIHPFSFGGMEHQTITSINRDWLRGWAEVGLAHEAAHHWIGDLITCATWDDIWMNEGGATWFEALWLENINKSEDSYYQHMVSRTDYFFIQNDAHIYPVYGVPENLVFSKSYITYNKAGWVYHMLSELVGRKEFFEVMTKVFDNNKFRSLTTQEFLDQIKLNVKSSKMDLDLYFDQWVYSSGYIKYNLGIEQLESTSGKYKYEVTVSQVQTGNGYLDVYKMPVDLVFFNDAQTILEFKSVYNDQRSQKFIYEFDFPVRTVLVDNRKVLCRNEKVAVSIDKSNNLESAFYPNPAKDYIEIVSTNKNEISQINPANIQIFDVLGAEVIRAQNYNTKLDISMLKAGIYFIKIGNDIHKLVKI